MDQSLKTQAKFLLTRTEDSPRTWAGCLGGSSRTSTTAVLLICAKQTLELQEDSATEQDLHPIAVEAITESNFVERWTRFRFCHTHSKPALKHIQRALMHFSGGDPLPKIRTRIRGR